MTLAVWVFLFAGCDREIGGYLPASAIAEGGFSRSERVAGAHEGREIAVWGFVDHGNLYGDRGTKRILGDWWSGDGPSPTLWRFDLKAHADDPVGHSFSVRVPNDTGRDALLEAFVGDARAQKPTWVFVKGRLFLFQAPLGLTHRTGLYLEPRSSRDVLLKPPADQ